jgi:ribosomal protein L12E/L44/L45/RPP1/RPP2
MKHSTLPAVCLALATIAGSAVRSHAQSTNGSPAATAAATPSESTNAPALVAIPPVPSLPPAVAEVVQLVRRGISESVVTDYIAQIREPFTLGADQVIYLYDLGISGPVLQALLKKAGGSLDDDVVQNVLVQAGISTNNAPVSAAEAKSTENVLLNPYLTSTAAAPGPTGQSAHNQAGMAPPAPAGSVASAAPSQPVVVNQQIFYESLAPYGSWVEVPSYGWCWQPTVAVVNSSWIPYGDGGRWVWTDRGWYWHSSYTWGWGPYHYGRWHRHGRHGWVWAPGYDWAPAWVAWRSTPTYCGWAPLPPECHWRSGVGFSWVNGRTSVGIGFGIGHDWWFATTWNRFCEPVRPLHRLPAHGVRQFVNDSRITVAGGNAVNIRGNNNTVIINNGVSREEVQRHTRDEIRRTEIRDVNSPAATQSLAGGRPSPAGRPSELAVYRPTIPVQASKPSATALAKPAPVRTSFNGIPPSGSSSRPLPVPQAGVARPSGASMGTPRPAAAGTLASPKPNSLVSPSFGGGQVSRPAPSVSQAPLPTASQAPATTARPGSVPGVGRGEVLRPGSSPVRANNPAVSSPAPVASQIRPGTGFAPAPSPTVSIPSGRPSSAGSFRPTPAPVSNYSKPEGGGFVSPAQAKPSFSTQPKPVDNYRPPSSESFRPSASGFSPSRPAPTPAPAQAPSAAPSSGRQPNPGGPNRKNEP